ncbi:MAG: HD domain-containing protein [Desulfovibrio sp.]|jgi:hypothetical protein|nr:HD domain-containing protein [Desulfovibrio sp.]
MAKDVAKRNIDEEYYQIGPEILGSFAKYRPPVDLFRFRDDIAVLEPYSRKDARLTNEQVEEVAKLCEDGDLFVSRSDHPIYSRHIVKQLDLVLQDRNLKEAEIADICLRALHMRYTAFIGQPVKAVFDPLYRDFSVFTEIIMGDRHRLTAFLRRLFRKHEPARHAINSMIVGMWLWLQLVSDYRRKELDRTGLALLLHDVGMCKVPAFLVGKAGRLKPDEREKVLLHPHLGVQMMQKLDVNFEEFVQACYEHHERNDGSGYPRKASGSQISRMGRIAAVADSFCAMIAERSYAQAMDPVDAARTLADDKRRYDEEMTRLLFSLVSTWPEPIPMDDAIEAT